MHPRNRVCQGVTVNLVRQRPTLRRTTPPTPRVPVYAGAFYVMRDIRDVRNERPDRVGPPGI